MKRKNEKGFTLVLSLLLLLVMSLMGGALIVISSGDHQSNNSSDEYQQTFYVAETALLEAEKDIINKMMGPWWDVSKIPLMPAAGSTSEEAAAWNAYVINLQTTAVGGFVRHTENRELPRNTIAAQNTPCFNSFRNIVKTGFQVTQHIINQNFGTLIAPVFANEVELDNIAASDTTKPDIIANEQTHMQRFRYEYFAVNIGSAAYRGGGSSLKKTTTTTQTSGTAYRIYGCGYMMPKEEAGFDNPDILVPLETVVVLSN
jgi:type II secretory pathway pseudopilin PulG